MARLSFTDMSSDDLYSSDESIFSDASDSEKEIFQGENGKNDERLARMKNSANDLMTECEQLNVDINEIKRRFDTDAAAEKLNSKLKNDLKALDNEFKTKQKTYDKIAKESSILIGQKAKNDKDYDLLIQHLRSELRRKNQILNQINSFFTHSV